MPRYTITTPDEQKLGNGPAPEGVHSYGVISTLTGEVCPTGQYTANPAGAPFHDYDDAYYAGASPTLNYTDNGDGTLTDNNTGLMWPADPFDLGTGWDAQCSWEVGLHRCNALTYAGHTDWRMPNFKELVSIMDESHTYPNVSGDFTNVQDDAYWTSTTDPNGTGDALTVDFGDNWTDMDDKTDANWVIPVRTA